LRTECIIVQGNGAHALNYLSLFPTLNICLQFVRRNAAQHCKQTMNTWRYERLAAPSRPLPALDFRRGSTAYLLGNYTPINDSFNQLFRICRTIDKQLKSKKACFIPNTV
jgi:hypothetical protein